MGDFGRYAQFRARPDDRGRLAECLADAARALEGVDACESFRVSALADDENTMCIHEIWRTREDFELTSDAPPFRAIVEVVVGLLDGAPITHDLVPIGGRG